MAAQLTRNAFWVLVAQKFKALPAAHLLDALPVSWPKMQLAGVKRSVAGPAEMLPHRGDFRGWGRPVYLYAGLMRHPTAEQAAARRAAYRGRAVRVQKAQPAVDERVHVRCMDVRVAVGA